MFMESYSTDFFVCVFLQVETWPAPLYLATHLTSPRQDKAATPPPHLLEWFLVGDATPFFYNAINFSFKGFIFTPTLQLILFKELSAL